MSERDWADRFSLDVDSILNQAGRTDSEPSPTEYRQALDLAHTLATTDFSTESRVRQELRHRLMNRISEREEGQRRNVYPVRPSLSRRRSAVLLMTVLVVFLLSTLGLAAYPPTRALAQETWQTVLRTVQLIRALPRLTGEALAGGLTTSIESPAEAVSLVDFPVRAPSYLPQDYEFKFGLVSHLPVQSVSFDYGIPYGRIVILPNGRAISGETYRGLRIFQMKGSFPGMWPIGEAIAQEVTVGGRPALWLTGLPVIQAQASVTVRGTVKDNEEVEREVLSRQETPPEVLARTPITALVWEEGDSLLSVFDLDGRFPLEEMTRIAEGLVPISTLSPEKLPAPTPWPKTTGQEIASVEEMVAGAEFGPYVFDPLPQGWWLERIIGLDPSGRPVERRYLLQYRHSQDAQIRLIEGLSVPLLTWPNDIERGGGTLRHVADNGLEVWTSDMHQWARESSIKETARSNERPIPEEVHAMLLRAPDGFSLELIAIGVSWDETLTLIEHLTLAPGADPALNSRLMKGCYPCP
jgi:hypothetical protein